jgi:hypothetical protein
MKKSKKCCSERAKSCSGFIVYLIPSHFSLQFMGDYCPLNCNQLMKLSLSIDFHLCALLSYFRSRTQKFASTPINCYNFPCEIESNYSDRRFDFPEKFMNRMGKKVYRQKETMIIISLVRRKKKLSTFRKSFQTSIARHGNLRGMF